MCIFPTKLLGDVSIEEIIQPLLDDLESTNGTEIYDAYRDEKFIFNAVVAAVTGDLNARTALTGFTSSKISFISQYCRWLVKTDCMVSHL